MTRNIHEEIKEAKETVARLERELARTASLPPAFRIAELLHEQFCKTNHDDGCSWGYTNWSEYAVSPDATKNARHRWVVKARSLLSQFTEDSIEIFITHLKHDGLH